MRTLLLIAGLLAPFHAWSIEVLPPLPICASGNCAEPFQKIYDEFVPAGPMESSRIPFVVSGECYHQAPNLNPFHQHWGVVLMDRKDELVHTGGSYGFFQKENPYSQWTVETVRQNSPNLYTEDHRVYLTEKFAFADMNKGGTGLKRWQYWYKQNATNFYVMGAWGRDHFLLCRMRENSSAPEQADSHE